MSRPELTRDRMLDISGVVVVTVALLVYGVLQVGATSVPVSVPVSVEQKCSMVKPDVGGAS